MRVITYDNETFARACRTLAAQVHSSGFVPDVILGIRRGGEYVAHGMLDFFPGAELMTVSLQRPSTQSKEHIGWMRGVLRHMPRFAADMLRMAEAKVRVMRIDPRPVCLPQDLERHASGNVLVTDDAVDTGSVLMSVTSALSNRWPDMSIRTAVLTVTMDSPAVEPDHTLFHDKTLLRFPWSMDARP